MNSGGAHNAAGVGNMEKISYYDFHDTQYVSWYFDMQTLKNYHEKLIYFFSISHTVAH